MNIAVASCCKLQSHLAQSAWTEIQNEHPDSPLLIGDNVPFAEK